MRQKSVRSNMRPPDSFHWPNRSFARPWRFTSGQSQRVSGPRFTNHAHESRAQAKAYHGAAALVCIVMKAGASSWCASTPPAQRTEVRPAVQARQRFTASGIATEPQAGIERSHELQPLAHQRGLRRDLAALAGSVNFDARLCDSFKIARISSVNRVSATWGSSSIPNGSPPTMYRRSGFCLLYKLCHRVITATGNRRRLRRETTSPIHPAMQIPASSSVRFGHCPAALPGVGSRIDPLPSVDRRGLYRQTFH